MSQWEFGRITSFLENIVGGSDAIRDWLQTQTKDELDRAEFFRRFDDVDHDWSDLKRLVKGLRSTRR